MQPTNQELSDSIRELKNYRDRLRTEIINISQKLRMSKSKIEESLIQNDELKTLETSIKNLNEQLNNN